MIRAVLALALVGCGARTGGTPPAGPDGTADAPRADILRLDLRRMDAPVAPAGWARSAGGDKVDWGWDIAVDPAGNAYVTGHFAGTAFFGPHSLWSKGSSDIFVAKLGPDGSWLWAVSAGGLGDDKGCGVALDTSGNVVVTGLFHDKLAVGGTTLGSKGSSDVFVASYTPDGHPLWAVRGGGPGSDWGWQVHSDGKGGTFLCGKYNGQATFGSIVLPAIAGDEAFVARLDPTGSFSWAKGAGWYGGESAWGVTSDGMGHAVATGRFEWTVDFGSITLGSAGGEDIFLAKYAPGGAVLWAVSAGGNGQDWGWAVAPDGTGGVYLTGFFEGLGHFGSTNLESKGGGDLFVTRHSAAGKQMWVATAGGPKLDRGYDVLADGTGAVVVGYFAEQIQFGGAPLASKGDWDLFVARLGATGQWDWAISAGGPGHDRPAAAAMGPGRALYLTGQYAGSSSFGTTQLTAKGPEDAFIWKLALP